MLLRINIKQVYFENKEIINDAKKKIMMKKKKKT